MTRAFRSEWVKLLRLSLLAGSAGAMAAFVALANFGMFRATSLVRQRGGGPGGPGGEALLAALSGPGGGVRGLVATSSLLGIIAMVVFASNVGGEYRLGTLRFLLAAQPNRLALLGGKLLALGSLVAGAVAAAAIVGLVTAFWFGALFDVPTSAWLTAAGIQELFSTYLNIVLACLGWGLLGAALAIVLRTSAAAIGIGVGYLLVGERIISQAVVSSVFDVQAAWFPGEVLGVFAAGGGDTSSYVRAAILAALYAAAAAAGAGLLFLRRDIAH